MSIQTRVFSYANRSAPVQLSTIEISDDLGPNDILVKTHYVGLNPVDLKLKKLAFYTSQWTFGEDFSGVVTKVGSKAASRFAVGDKVCGFKKVGTKGTVVGSTSRIDVSRNGVIKQPKNLDDAAAGALCLVYATSWAMLNNSKIDKNGSYLVLGGASATGSLCVQMLKRVHGVRRVVATCSPSSAKDVEKYGADEIINYRDPNYSANLQKAGANDKFLGIYDCVGGYTAIAISNDILLPANTGSAYVTINGDPEHTENYSGFNFIEHITSTARMAFRLAFGQYYNLRYKFPFASYETWPKTATKEIEEANISLHVGSVFPADEIKKAWVELDRASRGKIVLKF